MISTLTKPRPTFITVALISAAAIFSILTVPAYANDHKVKEAKVHQKFSECVAVRMREINIDHLKNFKPEKHATAVPEGWTVVSGTGGEGHPKLLLCR